MLNDVYVTISANVKIGNSGEFIEGNKNFLPLFVTKADYRIFTLFHSSVSLSLGLIFLFVRDVKF